MVDSDGLMRTHQDNPNGESRRDPAWFQPEAATGYAGRVFLKALILWFSLEGDEPKRADFIYQHTR